MKKIILTLAAISALGAAVPASAQYGQNGPYGQNGRPNYDNRGGRPDFHNRIEALRSQIQQGDRRGAITRNEAESLYKSVRKLEELERKYSRYGFTRSEEDKLQREIQQVREKIQKAERNGRYDRDDNRGRGGRYR